MAESRGISLPARVHRNSQNCRSPPAPHGGDLWGVRILQCRDGIMEMTAYLALKIFLSLILTYCFFDQFYSIRHFLLKLIVKNSIF